MKMTRIGPDIGSRTIKLAACENGIVVIRRKMLSATACADTAKLKIIPLETKEDKAK
jgi:hypothetical protein